MNLWTTKDGTKIPISQMSDSHLDNALKMVLKQIESYPGYQVYTGENDNSEAAVESENRINEERLAELMKACTALKREQVRREPRLSPVIQPEEVANFSEGEQL